MAKFIGRQYEVDILKHFMRKGIASFVVIKGRRRIGKSRLIEEFAKNYTSYTFTGLPPEARTTAQDQRNEFARQLSEQFGLPGLQANDWGDLFTVLANQTQKGRVVISFDEISWMAHKDHTFLGKIKNLWDTQLKKNNRLLFLLCGSASAWIEKNILASTAFVGRISQTLTLHELSIRECNQFWGVQHIAAFEKLKLLSITGGVPRYLEEITPSENAEKNIMRMCFSPGGLLTNEFNNLFSNLFNRNSDVYRRILESLSNTPLIAKEIAQKLNAEQSGRLSEYLEELLLAGFIKRDYTWQLKTGTESTQSKYRLSDNYLRFYLRYIARSSHKINKGSYQFSSLSALPGWESIMGLQFENLVLNSRHQIQHSIDLYPGDIINDNPFFQSRTTRQKGCQVDYLIQTRFQTLYVCEIKFSKHPIGLSIIDEVEAKIDAINKPRGFSCRPVLIHANGVTEEVESSQYFSHIIDFSEYLN